MHAIKPGTERTHLDNAVVYSSSADAIHRLAPTEPVYLFCEQQLRRQAECFQRGFSGELTYAVKANPEACVLKSLWSCGVRAFDVASIPEIALIRSLFPDAGLHYNNPVKTDEMVETAYRDYGVRSFVVDDLTGLRQLTALGDPGLEITVRFKLRHAQAAYDFGSKFGARPREATRLLRLAAESGARASLTFHPGSQCVDDGMYREYISEAGRIAAGAEVALYRLNVGGGFPVPYRDTDIPTLLSYFRTIRQTTETVFGNQAPLLLCEPGRALVAPSTSLLTRVNYVRENGEVYLNDGVYGGLQEQVITDIRLPYRVWRGSEPLDGHDKPVTVFGPTCDPVDRLPVKLALPRDIETGDWIEFGLLGAYGSATATRFNGFTSERYLHVEDGYCPTLHDEVSEAA